MIQRNIYKIFLLVTFSLVFSSGYNSNEVLAKVGEKEILVSDFLKRAEYSPRPLYCRGNTKLDKRIILNSLIGEKLFSIDIDLDQIPKEVDKYLEGRKNQKMREVLFKKINMDSEMQSEDFSHWFNLYPVEYDISYLSVFDNQKIEDIASEINNGKDLHEIYYKYSGANNIPTQLGMNIFNINNRSIREKLFKTQFDIGDIIGPFLTDDHITMFIQIDRTGKKIDLNPNSIYQKHEEIQSIINSHIAESSYQDYVKGLMNQMSFTLNPDIYFDFVELVKIWYSEIDKNKKNNEYERSLSDIRLDTTLLTLNNQEYSISDVMNWIDTHPLVFRDGYYKNLNFSNQVKFALADLIRDNQLDARAIELKLDNEQSVISEYEMWYDNYCALELRDTILGEDSQLNSMSVDKDLNEYFILLAQKYSNQIVIDVDLLDSISISSIDMITYNKTGPYKFVVPLFPIITNYHQFDYGQAVTMESK